MTPYNFHGTWLDLDHVQAIHAPQWPLDPRTTIWPDMSPNGWVFRLYGEVTLAFRSKPFYLACRVPVPGHFDMTPEERQAAQKAAIATATAQWNQFIEDWKTHQSRNAIL